MSGAHRELCWKLLTLVAAASWVCGQVSGGAAHWSLEDKRQYFLAPHSDKNIVCQSFFLIFQRLNKG